MPYIQDINPNVNIACRPGWCEEYVRKTYNQPAKYPTATAAWEGQEDKHTDRAQPGVAVPVYWGLSNEPAGHTAVWLPDGSVWSASIPNSTKPGKFASLEAIERYYGGKLQWRGWGTYVSHARVAHWEEPPTPPAPAPAPQPGGIQVGDTVVPTRLVDYNGTSLMQWDSTYQVTEVIGDRAVLEARGQVWAAMNVADIKKV